MFAAYSILSVASLTLRDEMLSNWVKLRSILRRIFNLSATACASTHHQDLEHVEAAEDTGIKPEVGQVST